ncbi:hypothetical protein E4U15_000209, partial [Claviceps sp. LM218 group G6]
PEKASSTRDGLGGLGKTSDATRSADAVDPGSTVTCRHHVPVDQLLQVPWQTPLPGGKTGALRGLLRLTDGDGGRVED